MRTQPRTAEQIAEDTTACEEDQLIGMQTQCFFIVWEWVQALHGMLQGDIAPKLVWFGESASRGPVLAVDVAIYQSSNRCCLWPCGS